MEAFEVVERKRRVENATGRGTECVAPRTLRRDKANIQRDRGRKMYRNVRKHEEKVLTALSQHVPGARR